MSTMVYLYDQEYVTKNEPGSEDRPAWHALLHPMMVPVESVSAISEGQSGLRSTGQDAVEQPPVTVTAIGMLNPSTSETRYNIIGAVSYHEHWNITSTVAEITWRRRTQRVYEQRCIPS